MAEGIDSQAQTYEELIAGDVEVFYCLLDTAATAAVGQVLKYDQAAYNFVDATDIVPGANGTPVVVCAEAKTLSADTRVKCIVRGRVRKDKLDTASQAFNHIEALLLNSGIIPVSGISG